MTKNIWPLCLILLASAAEANQGISFKAHSSNMNKAARDWKASAAGSTRVLVSCGLANRADAAARAKVIKEYGDKLGITRNPFAMASAKPEEGDAALHVRLAAVAIENEVRAAFRTAGTSAAQTDLDGQVRGRIASIQAHLEIIEKVRSGLEQRHGPITNLSSSFNRRQGEKCDRDFLVAVVRLQDLHKSALASLRAIEAEALSLIRSLKSWHADLEERRRLLETRPLGTDGACPVGFEEWRGVCARPERFDR